MLRVRAPAAAPAGSSRFFLERRQECGYFNFVSILLALIPKNYKNNQVPVYHFLKGKKGE
jgi:hypothetical protein